jgi:3-isopropylmalate/(R)-2-methylmalate dehydratase small subunit
VPLAMKGWGVRFVLGKSFARIFYRNCVNLGLPIVACREAAAAASDGSRIGFDTDSGEVEVDGRRFQGEPVQPLVRELAEAGGLVPWVREREGAR